MTRSCKGPIGNFHFFNKVCCVLIFLYCLHSFKVNSTTRALLTQRGSLAHLSCPTHKTTNLVALLQEYSASPGCMDSGLTAPSAIMRTRATRSNCSKHTERSSLHHPLLFRASWDQKHLQMRCSSRQVEHGAVLSTCC